MTELIDRNARFVDEVRKIDGELADLIKVELDRGVPLAIMTSFLQSSLEMKLAQDNAPRQPAPDPDGGTD